jgi:hypothetical protein
MIAMKSIKAAALLAVLATGAQAQPQVSTPARPCGAVQQLVLARGAAILRTGAHTYDRYVRDRNFCEFNEYIEPAFVPTADTPQCFAGYICREGPRELFDW